MDTILLLPCDYWRSGVVDNALDSINEVHLRRARLARLALTTVSCIRPQRSGAEPVHGAERWAGVAENDGAERSAEREVAPSRSGHGAGSGGYRNRLERRAAFSPLTLPSRALVLTYKIFLGLLMFRRQISLHYQMMPLILEVIHTRSFFHWMNRSYLE